MEEQLPTIPEAQKFQNEKSQQPNKISTQLICSTSLDKEMLKTISEDDKISLLIRLKTIHLEWLSLSRIQNLQIFTDLTILYLQHNNITKIEGLEHLTELEYLSLNGNQINKVEGISQLRKLLGLNLSHNPIEDLEPKELPLNIQLLNMSDCPLSFHANYKGTIIKQLPYLEQLDGVAITPQDKFKALGIFPTNLLGYSSQIKQFQRKMQIKKMNPTLFNTEPVNEREVQKEMREKTQKYMHENAQSFKAIQKQQVDNFEEKIAVSKRIREIKEKEERERVERINEIDRNKS